MTEIEPPQITYIFGAGASAQVLPTIKGLPERIKAVRNIIEEKFLFDEDEIFSPAEGFQFVKNDAKAFVLEGMDRLYKVSSNHSTVDTYAKKLYLNRRENEINELVFFLALYFNIEQKLVGVDPRYDTFLISILNSSTYNFPKNLKFLTWNYDSQMEIAHSKLAGVAAKDISPGLFDTDISRASKDEFFSVKINGTCNFKSRFQETKPIVRNLLTPHFGKQDLDIAMSYAYFHLKEKRKLFDMGVNVNFAWYRDNARLSKVGEFCAETEILVVIGYSFPFFNRETDRQVIREMTNLRKIYIQDCHPENIKSRFLSVLPDWEERNIQIIPVNDVTEFFLPPEL